jgi:SAM-dependent methyltransferase
MDFKDCNVIYRRMCARCRQRLKTPEEWDRRTADMNRQDAAANGYIACLLDAIDTTDCQSVFDVCCGTGHVLQALAPRMDYVYGLDFSKGMLQTARHNLQQAGIINGRLFLRAWEDSWEDLPRADLVTASRCMDVDDMAAALAKLDRLAHRRIYISYRAGPHHLSSDILTALGREEPPRPDYILPVNILYAMGKRPSLNYISFPRKTSVYPTFASLQGRVEWSLGPLAADETGRLQAFYDHLPENEHGKRIHPHPITWALISWEK